MHGPEALCHFTFRYSEKLRLFAGFMVGGNGLEPLTLSV
jgi:hypothetical protein